MRIPVKWNYSLQQYNKYLLAVERDNLVLQDSTIFDSKSATGESDGRTLSARKLKQALLVGGEWRKHIRMERGLQQPTQEEWVRITIEEVDGDVTTPHPPPASHGPGGHKYFNDALDEAHAM